MSIEPSFAEQEALAETLQRARSRMSTRERAAELLVGGGFAAAVALLWYLRPPGAFELTPALVCVAVMALATMVRFDTPLGFTVATQVAFVPLLFAVPDALVPIAVVAALALAQLPALARGAVGLRGLWLVLGNSWFAIGPVVVFAAANTTAPNASPGLLVAALAAQFVVDFVVSAGRFAIRRGASLRSQWGETWVYGIDAALSVIGLMVGELLHASPAVALAPVPLLGLLAVFSRERQQRLQGLLELNSAYRGTALVLGDVVEADDGYTGTHSKGVVALSLAVADRLALTAEQLRNLEFAALLHDVGKIAIPKEIINKPGKLDPNEWRIIKTHTVEGQRMLDRVGGFMREVGLIVRSHHERWDGAGYPDAIAGEQIPLESRIIACCDTWNAMRTDRVYRKALSHDAALAELRTAAGSQLDPRIVETLAQLVEVPHEAEASVPAPPAPQSSREVPESAGAVASVEDVRPRDAVQRLLEDSWDSRAERPRRRELVAEALAASLFLAAAVPLAVPALAAGHIRPGLAVLLIVVYAAASRAAKYPVGAGSVVPSYLVLVPMFLLLPPPVVPLFAAAGLVLGTAARVLARRSKVEQLLFAIPDAFHAIGPAVVLALAGTAHGVTLAGVYLCAFAAGCLVDLIASSVREAFATGIAPALQARVIMTVWTVDALLAPGGLLVAHAARQQPAELLFLLPVFGLLMLAARDRGARIAEAHQRLGLVARERTRLQAAVGRLGDAFTAKLNLCALTDVVLHGALDALDADAGQLTLHAHDRPLADQASGADELQPLLHMAIDAVAVEPTARQLERDNAHALALPVAFADGSGTLAIARRHRAFRDDEEALLIGLVKRAGNAVAEILAHEALRTEALTDPLTRLGNRRKLTEELAQHLATATLEKPVVLILFDLDGFKAYNDTFGHPAGDALLARLGTKLAAAVAPRGSAYRLGGDEFCALLPARPDELPRVATAAAHALEEHGETFTISASAGTVILPREADTVDYALQLADKRMYARKHGRRSGAREQAHDVLLHILKAKQPDLSAHAASVAKLAVPVGQRMGMTPEQLDELTRAAALHDIGNVAIPDTILSKPGPLNPEEWTFVRQHTLLGERILNAAPALRPIATIVRATHERWDGSGYPDNLQAEQIPLAARIIAVCDTYQAITTEHCYRQASTPHAAQEELRRQAGRQFDPDVVTAFLQELDQPCTPPTPRTEADKLTTHHHANIRRLPQPEAA